MGFGNPILGGTTLVRPAIQSPNFSQANQTGWAIDRNGNAFFYSVTVSGNVIVASATGAILVYSGPPALGNLIGSWAGTAGTDAEGNSYPQGLSVDVGILAGVAIAGTSVVLDPGPLLLYGITTQVTVTYTLTSQSPFVAPAGVTSLSKVECWGGGGARDNTVFANGGGGAGYAFNVNVAVTPGNSYPFTIPTAAPAGSGGNPCSFAGDAVTTTGHGGGPGNSSTGGGGGNGTFRGGSGGTGSLGDGGGGGSSAGTGSAGNNGAPGPPGTGGLAPAGGGAGGQGDTGPPGTGGNGAAPGGGGGAGTTGGLGGPGQIRLTFFPSGGATALIASIAAVAGIDPATGSAYPGPGVGLNTVPAPSGLAGWALLYGASGQPAAVNPAGLAVNLSGGQLATVSGFTAVTAATLHNLSAPFPIPAGDAEPGAIYRVIARGTGKTGSTLASNVLTLQSTLTGSLGSVVIGSGLFPVSTSFLWRIVVEAICDTNGSGGTWLGGLEGIITSAASGILPTAGADASFAFTAGIATPLAESTLAALSLVLQASWASTTGAPTLICTSSYPERIA